MDKAFIITHGMDMIYLAKCALNGSVPDRERVAAMDLEAVYQVAKFHSMTAVTYSALELLPKEQRPEAPILATWAEDRAKAVRKNILLDMEREKLLAFLESVGCWYMPLKGVYLKDMYPKMGMRQMADNDILFDPAFRKAVRDYMVANGFSIEIYNQSHHDEYFKAPVYNFEMHVALFNKALDPRWLAYYQDVKSRLIKDEGNQYGFHFTDNDFYVYFLLHAYKHFFAKGNGVRFLMDLTVMLSNENLKLDWGYVYKALNMLGIPDYERDSKELAFKVFSEGEPEYTEAEKMLLEYYLCSGSYGTLEQLAVNRLESFKEGKLTLKEKLRYLWHRLFPEPEFFKVYAPIAYKYKILIPFVAVWRIIKNILSQGKPIWNEIKLILTYKED